jgi:hypothetical protein
VTSQASGLEARAGLQLFALLPHGIAIEARAAGNATDAAVAATDAPAGLNADGISLRKIFHDSCCYPAESSHTGEVY